MSLEKYKSKIFTAAVVILDMYRVGTGTLLVLFVPGVCGGRACLPIDNWNNGDLLYRVGAACNLLTLLTFAALYAAEIRRENRLSTYLKSNPELPMDSVDVGLSIQRLTESRRTRLLTLNTQYQRIGYITIAMYVINTVISAAIIFTGYMNDKGPVLLVTNTLLIGGKLYDIYRTVNTEPNVFLSAYINHKVQFNDVVPTKTTAAFLAAHMKQKLDARSFDNIEDKREQSPTP
jgi:hypothetical protein